MSDSHRPQVEVFPPSHSTRKDLGAKENRELSVQQTHGEQHNTILHSPRSGNRYNITVFSFQGLSDTIRENPGKFWGSLASAFALGFTAIFATNPQSVELLLRPPINAQLSPLTLGHYEGSCTEGEAAGSTIHVEVGASGDQRFIIRTVRSVSRRYSAQLAVGGIVLFDDEGSLAGYAVATVNEIQMRMLRDCEVATVVRV